MKIVVGLGNPGRQYERTRHNAGFMVAERLAQRWGLGDARKAFGGVVCDGLAQPPQESDSLAQRVMLLKPQTYMNCSGQSVKGAVAFYKAPLTDLLVVSDDLALMPGRVRLRPEGSAGGHNGLSDIIRLLGSDKFARLRVGIGPSPECMDSADFVLSRFREDELETIDRALALAVDAVEEWLFKPLADVMAKYNGINLERKIEDE